MTPGQRAVLPRTYESSRDDKILDGEIAEHATTLCPCPGLTQLSSRLQPMKLGEHLNSLLLNMCDDVTLSRLSLRTVLDICSKHIRNSSCDPPFSYVRKLVRLVLGSLSQVCKM